MLRNFRVNNFQRQQVSAVVQCVLWTTQAKPAGGGKAPAPKAAVQNLVATDVQISDICIFQTYVVKMSDIKYTYFDLRVKGEPARLLLAYGGVAYTDDRVGWLQCCNDNDNDTAYNGLIKVDFNLTEPYHFDSFNQMSAQLDLTKP